MSREEVIVIDHSALRESKGGAGEAKEEALDPQTREVYMEPRQTADYVFEYDGRVFHAHSQLLCVGSKRMRAEIIDTLPAAPGSATLDKKRKGAAEEEVATIDEQESADGAGRSRRLVMRELIHPSVRAPAFHDFLKLLYYADIALLTSEPDAVALCAQYFLAPRVEQLCGQKLNQVWIKYSNEEKDAKAWSSLERAQKLNCNEWISSVVTHLAAKRHPHMLPGYGSSAPLIRGAIWRQFFERASSIYAVRLTTYEACSRCETKGR